MTLADNYGPPHCANIRVGLISALGQKEEGRDPLPGANWTRILFLLVEVARKGAMETGCKDSTSVIPTTFVGINCVPGTFKRHGDGSQVSCAQGTHRMK